MEIGRVLRLNIKEFFWETNGQMTDGRYLEIERVRVIPREKGEENREGKTERVRGKTEVPVLVLWVESVNP